VLTRLFLPRAVASIAIVLAIGVASCTSSAPAPADSPAPEPPTAVPSATPPPTATPRAPTAAVPFPPDLEAEALRLIDEIANLRGTPPRAPLQMYLISRQSAVEFYTPPPRTPGGEGRPPRLDLRQEVYRLLDFVPERSNVAEESTNYLGTLITGFYSSTLKAFYLLDDQGGVNSASSRATVVHEFTHALQDQYYGLERLAAAHGDDWDASRAFLSVIEGDAMDTERHFFGAPLRRLPACFTLPRPVAGTSYAVARDVDSWYFDGYCFIRAVMPRIEGIDAVFRRLPSTTEQLLHPEKWLAAEEARPVELTSLREALGGDWRELGQNRFGEYMLQNLLASGLTADVTRAQTGADGWGGDRFAVYVAGDQRLLQASTVWDSPEEAAAFWSALGASLRGRGGVAQPAREGALTIDVAGKRWHAAISGDRVGFVVSTDAAAAERASAALGLS
jgi:hypothetical protein